MTEREAFEASEQKREIMMGSGYRCVQCGAKGMFLAHHIAQSSVNIRKYGKQVIHHSKNMSLVCSDPRCNDLCSIGVDSIEGQELVKEIENDIGSGEPGE